MTGYIIKTTYLTGPHTGQVAYLRKGGYVTDLDRIHWDDDVYKTEGQCRAICTRYAVSNKRDHEWEIKDKAYRRAQGHDVWKFNIHELQSYEPYRVDDVVSSAL